MPIYYSDTSLTNWVRTAYVETYDDTDPEHQRDFINGTLRDIDDFWEYVTTDILPTVIPDWNLDVCFYRALLSSIDIPRVRTLIMEDLCIDFNDPNWDAFMSQSQPEQQTCQAFHP